MKIWLYSLMYNEIDFLPFYLRHYENLVDRIIIYDHHSDDGSAELARDHPLVKLRSYDAPGIHEPSQTELFNSCYKEARGKADWVIIADIDEIIFETNFRKALLAYQMIGVTLPYIKGYTMIHDQFPFPDARFGQIWWDHGLGVRDEVFDKRAIFDPEIEINYDHGRHRACPTGNVISSELRDFKLLHYRYWGADWLKQRHERDRARLSPENLANGWGSNKLESATGYYSAAWFEQQRSQRIEIL